MINLKYLCGNSFYNYNIENVIKQNFLKKYKR